MFSFKSRSSAWAIGRKLRGRPLRPHRPVLKLRKALKRQIIRRNIVRKPRTRRSVRSVKTPVRKAKRRRRRSSGAAAADALQGAVSA